MQTDPALSQSPQGGAEGAIPLQEPSFGAVLTSAGKVCFCLHAPEAKFVRISVDSGGDLLFMASQGGGWHSFETERAHAGSRYHFVLPNGRRIADPASRHQPDGLSGESVVVDPAAFVWSDQHWAGIPWETSVLYEVHIGAFTPEGTFRAAAEKLLHLRDLGITTIELMAIAEFPGQRGWSYDNVLLYAPHAAYGAPDELRHLINQAHSLGLAVILDVVYNHLNEEDNALPEYFPQFYSEKHETPWGKALNFDGAGSQATRAFILQNAVHWVTEYHVDGLRLDASHTMIDESPVHILDELEARIHGLGLDRPLHLILEHERNAARRTVRDPQGKIIAYAAQWNYDITRILGTVYHPAGRPNLKDTEAMAISLAEGFTFPLHEEGAVPDYLAPPTAMIAFIQTHDLVGNRIAGDRLSSNAETCLPRALACVYLLSPQIPMLLMGEEWGASTPFPFFSDYATQEQMDAMIKRRREQFEKIEPKPSEEEIQNAPAPQAEHTFLSARLRWEEIAAPHHSRWLHFYKALLKTRKERITPLLQGLSRACGTYRILAAAAFEVEWTLKGDAKLQLAANLSASEIDGWTPRASEPLWLEGAIPRENTLAAYTVRWHLDS